MSKKQFSYKGKTGFAETEGFKKKGLADYACNIGNICIFSCSYCYVPDMPFKHSSVKELIEAGHDTRQISNYRDHDNLLDTVTKDLKKISPDDTSTVFFCTTCDPCATSDHTKITTALARLILSQSNLQVRILSKSSKIIEVATGLSDFKGRVVYGLSTGTCLDEISKSVETNASPIKERVAALHWLQDNGYRVFGMICPVLPSEKGRVKELINQIRPELCEDIWVEAINDKGSSLTNTLAALNNSGLEWHAYALKSIMDDKNHWRRYAQELYTAFEREFERRGMLKKYHFLQYVTKADNTFFSVSRYAICL